MSEESPSVKVRPRRRPWLWAVGVMVISLGALLAGLAVNMMKATVPVVAVGKAVARGATLKAEDLVVVEINQDPKLQTVSAKDKDSMVGRSAAVELLPGTLLSPDAVTDKTVPEQGQAIVGVALSPTQMPSSGLREGQKVVLLSTPKQGEVVAGSGSSPAIRVEAEVITVGPVKDTNLTSVNVVVSRDRAEILAGQAATGQIALIVTGA